MAISILNASRAKDLPLTTMSVTLTQEWRGIPAHFSGATLAPEGEQDWSSSRREDCDKPHKGQPLSVVFGVAVRQQGAEIDVSTGVAWLGGVSPVGILAIFFRGPGPLLFTLTGSLSPQAKCHI
jgi:hypothetical protein